jgi:uncharacterized repeat protein (TIGR02543 family)
VLLGVVLAAGLVGVSTAAASARPAAASGGSSHTAGGQSVNRAATPSSSQGDCPCEVYVTVSGNGSVTGVGIDCPGTCIRTDPVNGFYETLTETPAAGQVFRGWGGGSCSSRGTSPTCTFLVGADAPSYVHVSAEFSGGPPLPTVTLTKAGDGSGSVTSVPAGIDCGATCFASFEPGTAVTLTAAADAGSTFTGWSGDCTGTTDPCTVTVDVSKSVTATFAALPKITVSDGGSGSGTVTSSPAGIDCGTTCAASFTAGTQVTLTAQAAANSLFLNWTGACTGTTATCTITASGATTAAATFAKLPTDQVTLAKRTKVAGCTVRGPLPDRRCSPGAIYEDAVPPLICAANYPATVKAVPVSEQNRVYTEYGIKRPRSAGAYEMDQIVPVELGGSDNIANLYPEAATPAPGYKVKDKLERKLRSLVCSGHLSLRLAQRDLASNWVLLYKHTFRTAP